MDSDNSLKHGWEACLASNLAAGASSYKGDAYVSCVKDAIKAMEDAINNHQQRGQGLDYFKGFVLEEWAAGTFNIDAVAAGSSDRARVMHETGYGSVDVRLYSGDQIQDYSMKAYNTPEAAATAQAILNKDTGEALYKGQKRLVQEDFVKDAKAAADRRYKNNILTRPKLAESYHETDKQLVDTIDNGKGVKGRSIDSKDLKKATKAAQKGEGEFKAANYGVTLDSSIDMKYVMEQAKQAGYSAAIISVAFQLTPEIFRCIDYLIKNGELTGEQLAHLGETTATAAATGFINGYLACALQIMIEKGAFGEGLKKVNPGWIGAAVAFVVDTIKDSIQVALGRKSPREMGATFVDRAVVGVGMVYGQIAGNVIGEAISQTSIGSVISGAVVQIIGFEFPVIGYVIGSLIGTAISVAYNFGKKKFLSICVDTGFTCFGLVDQDYEMPVEYLKSMGVDVVLPDFLTPDYAEADYLDADYIEPDYLEPETVEFYELKRGVIGVNKIGYISA